MWRFPHDFIFVYFTEFTELKLQWNILHVIEKDSEQWNFHKPNV